MKNHPFILFAASFLCGLLLCSAVTVSYVFFPIPAADLSPLTRDFARGKTDAAYALMSNEFATIVGYKSFDDFISKVQVITDKSVADKPVSEKVQEVAKLLNYNSFEELYFGAVELFNTKNPPKLKQDNNVYFARDENVFHAPYCEVLRGSSKKIYAVPSRENALELGLSQCKNCGK